MIGFYNIDNSSGTPRKYYPVPPVPPISIEYQDIGKNMNLRKDVTKYYLTNLIQWIEKDKNFKHLKKHLRSLKSKDGLEIIYNLLRLYVKNGKANWYDLRDSNNSPVIKDYLRYKIGEY